MKVLRFLLECIKLTVSSQMAYKLNFIGRTITLLSFDLILPFVTILIYIRSQGFSGWSFYDLLLFQGIFILANSVDRIFFQRIDWGLSHDVRSGNFDRYLLFPINTLAYMSFTNISIEHAADFLLGAGVIIFSVIKLRLDLTLQGFAVFLYYIALSLIFLFSMSVIRYSIIIRAVKTGRLGELFMDAKMYGQYPADIYNKFISSVIRYVIPLSVLAYFPAVAILNRAGPAAAFVSIPVAIFFALSLAMWHSTLQKYTSAGG